jgi:hypothetical protein
MAKKEYREDAQNKGENLEDERNESGAQQCRDEFVVTLKKTLPS